MLKSAVFRLKWPLTPWPIQSSTDLQWLSIDLMIMGSYNPDVASHCVDIERRSLQYRFARDSSETTPARNFPRAEKFPGGSRKSRFPRPLPGPESRFWFWGPFPVDSGYLSSLHHSLPSVEWDPICDGSAYGWTLIISYLTDNGHESSEIPMYIQVDYLSLGGPGIDSNQQVYTLRSLSLSIPGYASCSDQTNEIFG